MCYLKNIRPIQADFFVKQDQEIKQQTSIQAEIQSSTNLTSSYINSTNLLQQAIFTLLQNTTHITQVSQKIHDSVIKLNNIQQQMCQHEQEKQMQSEEQKIVIPKELKSSIFKQKQHYKFSLIMNDKFPDVIYKQRNISFTVRLIDSHHRPIKNVNVIHLCLGICDINGKWITQNRVGDAFFKGKTQIQCFHGMGQFHKIYPREISKKYSEGIINFVIYAKPSLIKYNAKPSCLETYVNCDDIKPLLIQKIKIKAKRKN